MTLQNLFSDITWLHNGWTIMQAADARYRNVIVTTLFPGENYFCKKFCTLMDTVKSCFKITLSCVYPRKLFIQPEKLVFIGSFLESIYSTLKTGQHYLGDVTPIKWPKHSNPCKVVLFTLFFLLPEIVWKKCILIPLFYLVATLVLSTSWLVFYCFIPIALFLWTCVKINIFLAMLVGSILFGVLALNYFVGLFFGRYILVLVLCVFYSFLTLLFPVRLGLFGLAYTCCRFNDWYNQFKTWLMEEDKENPK